MEYLKNHNTSPPRPSDSSKSGAKSSHSRTSQHSKTTTSSRRQVSDNSFPERRTSRTRSLDECRSHHYGNHSLSSVPRASASTSQKEDHSKSPDFSRSPWRRERKVRPRVERQEDGPSAQCHEGRPTDKTEAVNSGNVKPGVVNYEQSALYGARNF